MTRNSFLHYLCGGKTSADKSNRNEPKRKTLTMETLEDRQMLSVSFETPVESSYVPNTTGVVVNPNLVEHRMLLSGDFYNDGKIDLLAFQNGKFYSYRNSGSTTNAFPNAAELAADNLYTTIGAGVGKVIGGTGNNNIDLLTATMLDDVLTVSVYRGMANGRFYNTSTDTTWSGITSQGISIPDGGFLNTYLGDVFLVENSSGRVDVICTVVYDVVRADFSSFDSGVFNLLLTNKNNSTGEFNAPTVVKAGSTTIPTAILAAGDLTGDTKPDYVTANKDNNRKLDIYLNDGTKITTNDYGKVIGNIVVTKCHSGNKMEIITALSDSTGHYLCVTTVTGSGSSASLTYSEHYKLDIVPAYIVTGDFNNDGIYDIFVSNGSVHQTLLGQSNGKFVKQNAVIANADFMASYSADFTGDGNMDVLAVGKRFAWLIPGDGTAPTAVVDFTSLGISPKDIAFGDFNGDGKMDFAVLSGLSGNEVHVFSNQTTSAASPTFTRTSTLPASFGRQLLVGDFNNSGRDDIIIYGVNDSGSTNANPNLQTYLSTASGFAAVKTTSLPDTYDLLTVGEVTNDGLLDIVAIWNGNIGTKTPQISYYQVLENTSGNPDVFVAKSKVTFGTLTTYVTAMAVGDISGVSGGKNDLVLLDATTKSVMILPQTASAGVFYSSGTNFKTFSVTGNNVEIAAFNQLALGDFHAAGIMDVMVGVVTAGGNTQFRVMENDTANRGTLVTTTNFTTVGSFDGTTASGLVFHVGLLDDNGTADVVIVGGNTVKRFKNTDKSGAEIGTVTLVFRDYSSTIISTEIVDINTLTTGRLSYIDEWSNFWVEIWANTGTTAGISSFTTSLTFNADIFEVRSGKIEYGTGVTAGNPVINNSAGTITLSGTVTGSKGANTNTLLARVAFMPSNGSGIALNYLTNTQYVTPMANGFALDTTKSTLTTSTSATGQPQSAMLGTVPLFPVIYDLNDDGVVDTLDFTQFARAFLAGSFTASTAPPFIRLCDYTLDGKIDNFDFTWFALNFANGVSKEKSRTDPTSTSVRYPNNFTQVLPAPAPGGIAPALASLGGDVFDELFDGSAISESLIPSSVADQSSQNQALMAFVASQESKKDDSYDYNSLNPASETARLLAEGKL